MIVEGVIHFFRSSSWRHLAALAVYFALSSLPIRAQTSQAWPEISSFFNISPYSRFYFIATQTKENRQGTDAEIGPNFDFYLKPRYQPKNLPPIFRLDESRSRPLMLRLGYHYMPSTVGPTEHRGVLEATGRYPPQLGFMFSDRNKADLRVIDGDFTWRYRNRLTIERPLTIRSYQFTPYVRGELYFNSKYRKWDRTSETMGIVFPIRKHAEFEIYYEHQNDTSKPPNRQINAIGPVINLYF